MQSRDGASEAEFLVVQARQFGDAIIGIGIVEALGRTWPNATIDILTRPLFEDIFRNNPHVSRIFLANFPMGTVKRFSVREAVKLVRTLYKLRKRNYTVITLSGDFRENLIGWLVNPRRNVGVIWQKAHPFRSIVRQGCSLLLSAPVAVPVSMLNMYAVLQKVADSLGAAAPALPRVYDKDGLAIRHLPERCTVGFHMSATQACRLWPLENWRALIAHARLAGLRVRVFGAPSERAVLLAGLADVIEEDVTVETGSLQGFFSRFSEMQAVVCLDSFSIHAAYAVGVPSIMINGANLAAIWSPPGAHVIDGQAGLACAPCMNRPTCLGDERPYRCIRDISVERVWLALAALCAIPAPQEEQRATQRVTSKAPPE